MNSTATPLDVTNMNLGSGWSLLVKEGDDYWGLNEDHERVVITADEYAADLGNCTNQVVRKTFQSPYEQYDSRKGEEFDLVRVIAEPDSTHDFEILPMFVIRFRDGVEIEAWPEEVFGSKPNTGPDLPSWQDVSVARVVSAMQETVSAQSDTFDDSLVEQYPDKDEARSLLGLSSATWLGGGDLVIRLTNGRKYIAHFEEVQ